MDWDTLAGGIDAAVDDHLRSPGLLRFSNGEPDAPVRVHFEHPQEIEVVSENRLIKAKPWVEISLRLAPKLAKGDSVLLGARPPYAGWRVAANPVRPGDGRNWRAEVDPLGEVTA